MRARGYEKDSDGLTAVGVMEEVSKFLGKAESRPFTMAIPGEVLRGTITRANFDRCVRILGEDSSDDESE